LFQKRSLLIGKFLKRHSGVGGGVDTILILEVDDIVGDTVVDATGISVGTGQKLHVFLHLLAAYPELLTHFPVFFQIQQK